jgi:hypothetical protein
LSAHVGAELDRDRASRRGRRRIAHVDGLTVPCRARRPESGARAYPRVERRARAEIEAVPRRAGLPRSAVQLLRPLRRVPTAEQSRARIAIVREALERIARAERLPRSSTPWSGGARVPLARASRTRGPRRIRARPL